jgi:PAS domain S-box-containing protein
VLDEHGELQALIATFTDISDRKRMEEDLDEQRRFLRQVIDLNPALIFAKDRSGCFTLVNQTVADLFGVHVDDIVGKTDADLAPNPAEVAHFRKKDLEVMDTLQELFIPEEQLTDHEGRVHWLQTTKRPMIGADGNAHQVLGVAADITERRRMEQELRRSEQLFRAIVQDQTEMIVRWQPDFTLTFVNDAYCRNFGRSRDELLGRSFLPLVAEDQRDAVQRKIASLSPSNPILRDVHRVKLPDGTYGWQEWTDRAFFDDEGNMTYLQSLGRDITERMRSEQALGESESRFRLLVDANIIPVVFWGEGARVLKANERFLDMMDTTHDQLHGKHLNEFVAPKYQSFAEEKLMEVHRTGRCDAVEMEFVDAHGQLVPVMTAAAMPPGGKSGVAFAIDLRESKRAEAEREQLISELRRKNAELERFTYSVSHDLKTPLVTVHGFLGHMRKAAAAGNLEQFDRHIERVDTAVRTMKSLLDEMLDLAQSGMPLERQERVSMNELVRDAMQALAADIEAKQIQIDVASDLPEAVVDRRRMTEVFQNLLENAVHFSQQAKHPRIEIGWQEDDEATFYVRDNGPGIEARYLGRIWNLFEKLDPESQGAGTGLPLVRRIIEVHGGRTWAESPGLGHGATFYFTLPYANVITTPREAQS